MPKWRKSASHHVEEVKPPRGPRGEVSEPGRPPKVPGDGPVGEKMVFRGTPQKPVLKLQNNLPDALGDFQDVSG